MTIRYRERTFGKLRQGSMEALAAGLDSYTLPDTYLVHEGCFDVPDNPGGQNMFLAEQHRYAFCRVDGKIGWAWRAHDVPSKSRANYASPPAGFPTDSVAVTQFMARTNPSRANVDVFTFLAELRDLPKMVKSTGDFFLKRPISFPDSIKRLSGNFLNWEFGWKPLLSDLGKMLDFTETVDNRVRELESLMSGKGLRRKITVYDSGWLIYPDYSGNFYPVPAYGVDLTAVADLRHYWKKWVTGTWRPTSSTPIVNGAAQRALAESLVFGHNISPKQVWDLMPWSWLIDWFTTTGDFIAAHRNHIGAICTDVCVMTYAEARWANIRPVNNPYNASIKEIDQVGWIHKERNPASATPSLEVNLPFLSGRQLSILSALAITRGIR